MGNAWSVSTGRNYASCLTSTAAASRPANGRITPSTSAAASNGRIRGTAPFTVNFNMCRTVDPEGDPLNFTMDFENDGVLDVQGRTGASCREPWTYPAGTWKPEICVTDLGPEGERLHPFQCQKYTVEAS